MANFYSAAEHRSRGALWPSFALARIDHREFVMTQAHGSILGGSATSNPEEGAVAIRFEEYGANSYRITPDKPLAPGEYALAARGLVSELYCFGVDR